MSERSINISLIALSAFAAGIGGILFGYDTAVINGANTSLQEFFGLDKDKDAFLIGLVTSSAIIGCIPGALLAGFISDRIGRKKVLFMSALLFSVSAIWSAFPGSLTLFLVARFIGGLGIGFASVVCPIYIAEISPPAWRGRLGALFQLGIVFGIAITLYINKMIHELGTKQWNVDWGWRWMIGSEIIPAALFVVLLIMVIESPRWLIQSGNEDKARDILTRIGGDSYASEEIEAVNEALTLEEGKFSELFQRTYSRPLIIAIAVTFGAQLSGINAIMYYSTEIFKEAAANTAANTADNTADKATADKVDAAKAKAAFTYSAWIGLANLLATFVAIALVDRIGRKPLMLFGNAIQVVALVSVGLLFFFYKDSLPLDLLFGFVILYTVSFAVAMGPIPWILCSEIFPARLRGRAMSIAAFCIWVGCLSVTQTVPIMLSKLGPHITFWIYGTCSALTFIFVLLVIPETKGKSLEEIEKSWISQRRDSPEFKGDHA